MLVDMLAGFVQELRASGIPVSMVETIDAMSALRHCDIGDREMFKAALGATLVKSARHYETFDTVFEVFFALHRSAPGDEANEDPFGLLGPQLDFSGNVGQGDADLEGLLAALQEALMGEDFGAMQQLARQAVEQLAGMESGRPVGGTYYLYRTLRQLGIDEMLENMITEASAGVALTALEERLLREDLEERLEELKAEIKAEIRRRLVADRGSEAVAKALRKPLLEDSDLMHAARDDLVELEHLIQPLTRKLASRLAQKRKRKRDGRLDFRKTVRKSLSTGGVPLEPQFRAPRPTKPEVFLLCDISGSMATFARFTLQFTYAMSGQFSNLRSFAFIDALDEVTGYFDNETDFNQALHRVSTEANVVWTDGHSDYGRSLEQFWTRFAGALSPRSTVIITGDARNNYRDAKSEVVGEIAEIARSVHWLNPEPQAYWDTGDSVMRQYKDYCTDVHEVRNLRQIEKFVEAVAVSALPVSQRQNHKSRILS